MKKLNYVMMIGIFCFALVGCTVSKGSFSSIMSIGSSTMHLWKMSYQSLNGEVTKYIKLKQDDVVSFDITSEKGELSISLIDELGESIYTETEISTSTFEVAIPKSGGYELMVNAKNHKGSFNIDWGKASNKVE